MKAVDCEGAITFCEYFERKRYGGGIAIRCNHPNIMTIKKMHRDKIGAILKTLKSCPKTW